MNRWLRAALASAATMFCAAAFSQIYPAKPIKIVLGFPPGSVQEGVGRLITTEMQKKYNQPIVFEVKAGANGSIAGKFVAASAPDGYTLFLGNSIIFHPLFMANNSIDAAKELAPVSQLSSAPRGLIASGKLPVTTFQDLLAYAKAQREPLRFGAATPTDELTMVMLSAHTGLKAEVIPYKSSAQAITAIMAGEVDLMVGLSGYLTNDKVRGLLVLAAKRVQQAPTVPASSEVGLGNFALPGFVGLWAPLGTPRELIQSLSTEAGLAARMPSVAERMQKSYSSDAIGSTPEELLQAQHKEMAFWAEAAKLGNFKPR